MRIVAFELMGSTTGKERRKEEEFAFHAQHETRQVIMMMMITSPEEESSLDGWRVGFGSLFPVGLVERYNFKGIWI